MINVGTGKKSGMVLVMVLMAIMVMSVYVISILSQSMNQGLSGQAQIDRIKAEQLAKGAFWKAHSDLIAGAVPTNSVVTLDGKAFTISEDPTQEAVTNRYTVNVAY